MDPKTFFVIYPSYMDSCKTMKLGRRVGIENSIPTPTVNDISEGLQILNLRHVLEPHKGYSRDPTTLWDNPGRVKVEPTGGQYTKRSLLIELSSIIITLPSRIRRIEVIAAVEKAKEIKRQEQQEEKKKLAISSNQPKASKLPTSKNKKKGKKKR
jgi:signal recognition particle subunit SRP19